MNSLKMSWVPKTDFEEEVVNLQPDHDFIYGTLSEPQYTYPRPQSHVEYAENKKIKKNEPDNNGTVNKINAKLKAITEVQRMARTKPLGELPSIDDWDNNDKIEQEIVGMMRYHGLPSSVEQPLNEKLTISSFPVENEIKVVKNGHKKVAYFFDDNVFQLKQKVSDSSSGIESSNANDSLGSCTRDNESSSNTSFNTSNAFSSHSFSTCDSSDLTNSFTSALTSNQIATDQNSINLNVQRLRQYEKLLEDTASLTLNSNSTKTSGSSDSFKSTKKSKNSWKPLPDDYDVDNILSNCEEWPDLLKKKSNACNLSTCSDCSHSKSLSDSNNIFTTDINTTSSSSGSGNNRINFLERFYEPENSKKSTASGKSSSTASVKKISCEPKTYASITKEIEKSKKSTSTPSEEIDSFEFVPFYTPRKIYALKRQAK